jgi:protein-tyrosine phosphatase
VNAPWIELAGAHNVRDLGGLRAGRGHTRTGVLMRSDALDQLTADDVEQLVARIGLVHVVDLRSARERQARGRGPLGDTAVRYTEVEVVGPADLARRAAERAAALAAGEPPERILGNGYVELLELGSAAFAEAFRRIAEPGGSPALVHCAIGKDRTGVLCALLLDAAGVDRDEIVADYARTGERAATLVAGRLGEAGIGEQVAAFTQIAHPGAIELVLDHLDARWGGAAGFLTGHGLATGAIDAWRERLVAPSA